MSHNVNLEFVSQATSRKRKTVVLFPMPFDPAFDIPVASSIFLGGGSLLNLPLPTLPNLMCPASGIHSKLPLLLLHTDCSKVNVFY